MLWTAWKPTTKLIPTSMTETTNRFDLGLEDVLEAQRIYDPSIDGSIDEVFELIRDHNQITTDAEFHHHITHV
jgi:hypothetical protein